jgi:aspartyl-tRNA(Asn)/glutamyl-tRNA(Gln) amidotransferase subunit C
MPALTPKEVEEIALLARLHLDEAELARMQEELGTLVEHFGAIAAAQTENVPPMTHAVPMDLRLRADVVEPSLDAADALRGAPQREGDLFVVPAIIVERPE